MLPAGFNSSQFACNFHNIGDTAVHRSSIVSCVGDSLLIKLVVKIGAFPWIFPNVLE